MDQAARGAGAVAGVGRQAGQRVGRRGGRWYGRGAARSTNGADGAGEGGRGGRRGAGDGERGGRQSQPDQILTPSSPRRVPPNQRRPMVLSTYRYQTYHGHHTVRAHVLLFGARAKGGRAHSHAQGRSPHCHLRGERLRSLAGAGVLGALVRAATTRTKCTSAKRLVRHRRSKSNTVEPSGRSMLSSCTRARASATTVTRRSCQSSPRGSAPSPAGNAQSSAGARESAGRRRTGAKNGRPPPTPGFSPSAKV
jgi:hypothetical protein